jgi:hypothetical protein
MITYVSKTRRRGQALYNTFDLRFNMALDYGELVRLFPCILYIVCVRACVHVCVCVCVCVGGWVYKRVRTHPRFDHKISL